LYRKAILAIILLIALSSCTFSNEDIPALVTSGGDPTGSTDPAASDSVNPDVGAKDTGAGKSLQDRGFGQILPFSATDLDGGLVTQDVFGEKSITFINYWATWCGPCRSELPDFPEMYEKYKDQVTFMTIVDDGKDNADAKRLTEQYLTGYINLLPTMELVSAIESGYVPTTVIVGSEGHLLVDKIIGAVGDYSEYIDAALEIVGD
jgi:thiol-disulfide isomerase/thioredoxin